jgi:hypothetical protein
MEQARSIEPGVIVILLNSENGHFIKFLRALTRLVLDYSRAEVSSPFFLGKNLGGREKAKKLKVLTEISPRHLNIGS